MASQRTPPLARRALFTAVLGGFAAVAAHLLGAPPAARGDTGDSLILGQSNSADATTTLVKTTSGGYPAALEAYGTGGGTGILGSSTSGLGVAAVSESGFALWASSTSGNAVVAESESAATPAVVVQGIGEAAGLFAYSGATLPSSVPTKTGVYATAVDAVDACGVHGFNPTGTGVRGTSNSGVGVAGASTAAVGVKGASGIDAADTPDPITPGTGVYGFATTGHGVYGASLTSAGIYAATSAADAAAVVGHGAGSGIHGHTGGALPTTPSDVGVYGSADGAARGVAGRSESGPGVYGEADTGFGVWGACSVGVGLLGTTESGHGLLATATGAGIGALGESNSGTGVQGYSGTADRPAAPTRTGVFGYAADDPAARGVTGQTTFGRGVNGQATSGRGVHGYASTGVGVYAAAGAGGTALQVVGVARFSRSGKATVTAGTSSVVVSGLTLTSASLIFANPMQRRAGVFVAAVVPAVTAGAFTIYLSQSVASDTRVAWFVAN